MKLALVVEAPARWLRTSSEHSAGLFRATLAVVGFSAVNALGIVLRFQLPAVGPDMEWAWRMGVVFGLIVALFAGFLLWLYLVVGVALTLRTLGRVVRLAVVTRLVGLAFFFPFVGMTGLLLLWVVSSPSAVFNGVYVCSVVWGLLALTRSISDAHGISWADTAIALVVPIIVAEVLFVLLRLV